MKITEKGEYKLTKDFLTRNTCTGSKLSKGTIITIEQVDLAGHKVIGPQLMDWHPYNMPVERIKQ